MIKSDAGVIRAMADRKGEDEGTVRGVPTRTRTRTKKPSLYKVLMLNDDYTPMEFVVLCLQRFFRMGLEDATRVMLSVHQKGVGVCGIFTYEVAETKVSQVIDFARQHQHPLQCTLEKALFFSALQHPLKLAAEVRRMSDRTTKSSYPFADS